MRRTSILGGLALAVAASGLPACGDRPAGTPLSPGAATPAGYWEGKVTTSETPMKDHARTLTRSVTAELWFTVEWDAARNVGIAAGEADAVYDATLTVKNLPKVTAPVPGGSVKFEPEVGGTLTKSDNRRRFPVYGVLHVDPATGRGTLVLQQGATADSRTDAQRLDDEAKGVKPPGAPMDFTIRGDPGVSGGFGGVAYSGGMVTVEAGGAEVGADTGSPDGSVVLVVPMTPFSPFSDKPGAVEKRPGGPYVASLEQKGEKDLSIVWTVKQVGGETREPPRITPEMRRDIDALVERLRAPR
jgi:hypothetical protein